MLVRSLSDAALAARAAKGDADAFAELARRNRALISRVTSWAPLGLTREDLRQEALIGLFEACRAYEGGRGAFDKLASTCVYHHVLRASRDATRRKQLVLSEALGLDYRRFGDDEQATIAERLPAPDAVDPARVVELREELRERTAGRRWREQQARRSGRQLYSDEQIAQALALVDEGKSFREAGAAVGAQHTTVMRWRRRAA